jgi:hypothetical protein
MSSLVVPLFVVNVPGTAPNAPTLYWPAEGNYLKSEVVPKRIAGAGGRPIKKGAVLGIGEGVVDVYASEQAQD